MTQDTNLALWFDDVIERGKQIILEHFKETFKRYRAMGKLILESGYQKGQWRSEHRKRALDEWGISRQTFGYMVQLGELKDVEFADAISNFSSVYAWTHRGKHVVPQKETSKPRLITKYGDNIYRVSTKFQTSRKDGFYVIKEGDPYPTLKRRTWFFHEDMKEFTLREYATVQEFPHNFKFVGSVKQVKDQIGNAVPPPMACHVTRRFSPCNAIDLFGGAGGMSLGVEIAGHKVLAMVEWDRACCYTYRTNFPHTKVLQRDMREISIEEIKEATENQDIGLVFAGPPCQGFSLSGLRFKDDPRNELYKEFLRVAQGLNAKHLVMENVMGVLGFKDQILEDFTAIGYDTICEVVKGEEIGMRQKRHRVFFIGSH